MSQLLTVPEAAARLNVSVRWMRRAIFEQRFDTIRLGRLVRIPADALDGYVESNRQYAQRGEWPKTLGKYEANERNILKELGGGTR